MKHDIYEMEHDPIVAEILEQLRKTIANKAGLGVTLVGNRLTVRWHSPGWPKTGLRQVHMVILEVEDGEKEIEEIPQ